MKQIGKILFGIVNTFVFSTSGFLWASDHLNQNDGCSIHSDSKEIGVDSKGLDSEKDLKKMELEKIVVLSRHNTRSPLCGEGSNLSELINPNYKWFNWSTRESELSLNGGVGETRLGQYFNKYLDHNKLIPDPNYVPENPEEFRIYTNSVQRCIATGKYFAAGLLPIANVPVEYHEKIGTMDSVFDPILKNIGKSFIEKSLSEIPETMGTQSFDGILGNLSENLKILEKVLDFKSSIYAKKHNMTEFKKNNLVISLNDGKEPKASEELKLIRDAASALLLQYYEELDDNKALFGNKLDYDELKKIVEIEDVYQRTLFTSPTVAKNIAAPILNTIKNELTCKNRKFSYLCGHDSNIHTSLAALNIDSYSLPQSLTQTVPIGSKLVFEVWLDTNQEKYLKLYLLYPSVDQIRTLKQIDLENPPCKCDLKFKDLKSHDGLYNFNDVIEKLECIIRLNNPKDDLQNNHNLKLAS